MLEFNNEQPNIAEEYERLKFDYRYYLVSELKLSDKTVLSYIGDIEKYFSYLTIRKIPKIEETQLDDVRKYINTLKRKNLKSSTISHNITSIKSFYKFLVLEKRIKNNFTKSLDTPKIEKKLPSVLSQEEIHLLLDNFIINSFHDYRTIAMLEVMYSCGLRISEVLDLKISDLHLDLSFIKVLGKGSKERIVPVGEIAIDRINKYLQNARPILLKKNTDILFLNNSGNKMTKQTVSTLLKERAKEVGITKKISPHTLRHSFASHLLASGTDLRLIQELLGHEDISTTEIYTHITNEKLNQIFQNAHPHARKVKNNE